MKCLMRILAGIGGLGVLVAVGFFVFAIFYSDPIESSLDRCAAIQSERGFEELNKWKLKMGTYIREYPRGRKQIAPVFST